MASKRTPTGLTLKLDGQHITADRFLKAVSSFVGLINEVSETVTGERGAFRWIVTVESGSAIVASAWSAIRRNNSSFEPK